MQQFMSKLLISLSALLICAYNKYFAAFSSSALTAKGTPPKSCTFQYLYGFKTGLLSLLFCLSPD